MKCPECGKDQRTREFYDHMGEYHGWSLAEAEKWADDRYQEVNYDERT